MPNVTDMHLWCPSFLTVQMTEKENKLRAIGAFLKLFATYPENAKSGRYGAFALSNLAQNNHRQQIVDEGVIELVVSLACSNIWTVQTCSQYLHQPAVKHGILDPLVMIAWLEQVEVLREVAVAFNCLSSVEENTREMTHRVFSTVTALLLSDNMEAERNACCTIANLWDWPTFMLDSLESVAVLRLWPRWWRVPTYNAEGKQSIQGHSQLIGQHRRPTTSCSRGGHRTNGRKAIARMRRQHNSPAHFPTKWTNGSVECVESECEVCVPYRYRTHMTGALNEYFCTVPYVPYANPTIQRIAYAPVLATIPYFYA